MIESMFYFCHSQCQTKVEQDEGYFD